MPSSVNPSTIASGPGKVPVDTVTASSELFNAGSSQLIATLTDVLTQELAKTTSQTFTANAVTGDASRVLPSGAGGPYFVGSSSLNDLFKVVNDSDDTEIFNPSTGLYVTVSSMSVSPTGFVSTLQINFNTPVPPSTVYKVYYGRQYTLAGLPADFATSPQIRRSAERARLPEISRTGLAPTSVSNSQVYTASYPDPMLAQWKATLKGSNVSDYDDTRGGAIGFVHVGPLPHLLDGTGNDVFSDNLAGAAFLSAYEKDVRSNTFATSPVATTYTKIDSTLNAVTTATTVTLNASDYARVGNNTSFRLGVDMLEITFANGTKMAVIPTSFGSGNARTFENCKTLGGATAAIPAASNAKIKWLRPNFFVGGGHGKFSTEFHLAGMSVLSPGCITDQPGEEVEHVPPFFGAGTLQVTRPGVNSWNLKAFTWGSFTETGSSLSATGKRTVKGELRGDGSLLSLGGHVEGLLTTRYNSSVTILSTPQSYEFNPFDGSLLVLNFTLGSSDFTLTLNATYLADAKTGDQITIFVKTLGNPVQSLNITWPTQFRFSGTDGILGEYDNVFPSGNVSNTGQNTNIKYTGVFVEGVFYMTRTDYEVVV